MSNLIIGVIGAGTMGSGIAQLAARQGHEVVLADLDQQVLERAEKVISQNLDKEVAKERLTESAAREIQSRLRFVDLESPTKLDALASCGLVIEAIREDLESKRTVFAALEQSRGPDALWATNTSSLSITAIGASLRDPSRLVGMHFFNPAPIMPLVEIVPGLATSGSTSIAARDLAAAWGKVPVLARDTPGFIVNRVARPFYGEALRIYEEGIADFATIDWAMKELGRFRMGPFELMDLIGNDVNFAVTKSVFEALFYDPRYRPSLTQQRLVEAGFLGRKSGRGYYDYRDGATPPQPIRDFAVGTAIVDRIVAMLINEAADALYLGVADYNDLEVAMLKGVNYPRGLLSWADELGAAMVLDKLDALQAEYGEDRYRASPLLRKVARSNLKFANLGPHNRGLGNPGKERQ